MDQYHFLVGEFKKDSPFIAAAASAQLFAWFAHIGEPVERYGNKRGKVVKFSQRNYEKMLFAPETDSIELFSPRIVPPDEADETTNCDALVVYSSGSLFVLAIRASKLALAPLFDAARAIPGLFEHCEYMYCYAETQGYGTGYALGYRQLDEAHPMTFGIPCPANNWAAIKRRGLQDCAPARCISHQWFHASQTGCAAARAPTSAARRDAGLWPLRRACRPGSSGTCRPKNWKRPAPH